MKKGLKLIRNDFCNDKAFLVFWYTNHLKNYGSGNGSNLVIDEQNLHAIVFHLTCLTDSSRSRRDNLELGIFVRGMRMGRRDMSSIITLTDLLKSLGLREKSWNMSLRVIFEEDDYTEPLKISCLRWSWSFGCHLLRF